MNGTKAHDYLECGTRVLNTNDGEPGAILNGISFGTDRCYEYEVQTQYGIERWRRSDFIVLPDVEEHVR
jgi:hypothetical protein